jgi:hypothetical protein
MGKQKLLILFIFVFIFTSIRTPYSSGQACNPVPDPANLITNGNMECEDTNPNRAGMPYGWYVYRNDSNHTFAWVEDPEGTRGEVLMTENKVGGRSYNDYVSWHQTIYNIKPSTWYEFSVDFA